MKKNFLVGFITLILLIMCGCGNTQHEYKTGNWSSARNDAVDNLASARKKYVGEYYSFTGELTYIDEGFIAVDEVNPGKYTSSVT